ncbi:hypothetical protein [Amycolatopsis sp. NPDC058986]|uniref:hypothetical protein n=1 Tax=unclassified Amycolatopsis TaxID=2618356 RepID=UPI0036725489
MTESSPWGTPHPPISSPDAPLFPPKRSTQPVPPLLRAKFTDAADAQAVWVEYLKVATQPWYDDDANDPDDAYRTEWVRRLLVEYAGWEQVTAVVADRPGARAPVYAAAAAEHGYHWPQEEVDRHLDHLRWVLATSRSTWPEPTRTAWRRYLGAYANVSSTADHEPEWTGSAWRQAEREADALIDHLREQEILARHIVLDVVLPDPWHREQIEQVGAAVQMDARHLGCALRHLDGRARLAHQ